MPKMHLFSGMDNRQTADSLRCQQNILLVVQKRTPGKHTSWYGKILAMISGVYISQLVRQISEPINQLVPSSKVFSWGLFWAKVLHGSTICFCFISTTVYVSDIFRLCTVKAGDVGLFSFFNLSEVSEASTVWLCQCLFGWIPSFKILLCYFRNKSIGSICVSPKSFFFCNHLSGARAKYVKTACVASAAVSSCKFQEAYKVDRELNEWKKTQYSYIPLTKVFLRVVLFGGFSSSQRGASEKINTWNFLPDDDGFWPLTMVNLNVALHGWSHSKLQPNWLFMIMHENKNAVTASLRAKSAKQMEKEMTTVTRGKTQFVWGMIYFLKIWIYSDIERAILKLGDDVFCLHEKLVGASTWNLPKIWQQVERFPDCTCATHERFPDFCEADPTKRERCASGRAIRPVNVPVGFTKTQVMKWVRFISRG